MNVHPMKKNTTSVDRSFTRRQRSADHKRGSMLTGNHTNSKKVGKEIDKMKQSPLTSKDWYISFFSSQSS
jgi:hypothetical protein